MQPDFRGDIDAVMIEKAFRFAGAVGDVLERRFEFFARGRDHCFH